MNVVGKKYQKPIDKSSLTIVYRPLSSLRPYARNARTHSPEQIGKLRASLARYGWTTPIAVAGDDIIAGHARHQAATEMARIGQAVARNADPLLCPTVDLSALSDADRRAYIIADNRLAEDAGWDMSMLKLEFADLSAAGLDMSITGFNLDEITDILSFGDPSPADPADPELTAEQDACMSEAWMRAIRDWIAIIESSATREWISTSFTKGTLAVLYLRSLYFGDEIPRGASLAYTPNRVHTSADRGPIVEALQAALNPDAHTLRSSIRWVAAEKPSFDKFIGTASLPIHSRRLPNDFPALLARDLIDEFTPENGAVLDPCHGWGGRCLGFLLSHAERYDGYDPAPATSKGVSDMFTDLSALTPERKKIAKFVQRPFESAALKPASYDFALTSPPYYDTEKYDGEQSSWKAYGTFDAWVKGFYELLISKVARALKPDSVFALQVGSQTYPLKDTAILLAPKHGLEHVETRHTHMVNNRSGTEPDDGEVVIVLRKSA
jgi:hypothetical protein